VEIIQTTTDRAASLVRQLLAFGRRQMLHPAVVEPNVVVRTVTSLLRRVIGEHIELVLELGADVSQVLADPGQLEQVLMNLAVNARDAMPSGGRLTITTTEVGVDETFARRHVGAESGVYVRLTVSDVGHGMDEATRARAFEPFFTTKPQGKGTGLGLSTVYGIVRQSGGFIDLDSQLGVGTTFRIYLPRATGGVEPISTPAPPPSRDVLGTETVLVVEDDDDVRGITCQVLELNGYTVLEADDVEDAVRLARDHPGPIHLLVSDVVMPRMSGPELAEIVRERRPDIAVLYVSGYADESRFYGARAIEFLPKPFQIAELVRAVRERLDRRGAA
jgi:CheY-like chemotaxis protein